MFDAAPGPIQSRNLRTALASVVLFYTVLYTQRLLDVEFG